MLNSTPQPGQHTYIFGMGFCYDHEARQLIEAELRRRQPGRSKIVQLSADFDSAFSWGGRYCVYAGAWRKGNETIAYYSC